MKGLNICPSIFQVVIMMRSSKYFLFAGLVILLAALVVPGACAASTSESGYITVGLAPVAQFDAYYAFTVLPTTFFCPPHSRA